MYSTILICHITLGFIAIVTGLISIISRKGKTIHTKSGFIYFWSMCLVCLTALIMANLKPNMFLLSIAIFSFYMVFTGYRHTKRKSNTFQSIDITIMLLTLISSIGMVLYASSLYCNEVIDDAIVLSIFGGTCLMMSVQDLLEWRKVIKSKPWIFGHIARIGGSYIATITAFSTTNLQFWPQMYNWLLPSVIGSFLISYASIKTRKNFKSS